MVVVADPGVDGGGDEQWMPGEPLEQATAALHLLDHGGVEADAGVEQEVPVVDGSKADPTDGSGLDGVQQGTRGFDGVIRQADGAGEDVGRPAGQCRQGRIGPRQAVGGLVQRAVAAQDHDHVHAVVGGALGQPGGVAPAGGSRHLQAMVGREGLLDDDAGACGHRRGRRVHDQKQLHRRLLIRPGLVGPSPNHRSGRAPVGPGDRILLSKPCAWMVRLIPSQGTLLDMIVVVCVKQIPDPADPGALDPETRTLKRDVKLILDESDSYGVEMGLQLVDAAGEGEVRLVSMAPNNEVGGLRTALAMGAASAVLVSDEALAGSDALSTAKVLAAAIRRCEPDLILTATESSDGYTGTVPVQIAELLGLPSVTFGKEIEVTDGVATVKRQTEAGFDQVECPLPAVVSVTAGVVEPRYPSFKGIMGAKNKPVDELDLAGLGIDPATVGWSGARQEITDVAVAPARDAGQVVHDEGDAHERILAFLDDLKVL